MKKLLVCLVLCFIASFMFAEKYYLRQFNVNLNDTQENEITIESVVDFLGDGFSNVKNAYQDKYGNGYFLLKDENAVSKNRIVIVYTDDYINECQKKKIQAISNFCETMGNDLKRIADAYMTDAYMTDAYMKN